MGLLLFLPRPRGGLHLDDREHRGSRFGRALIAIRDAEVAAEASGIAKPGLLMLVFLFSGAIAGVAGGLFASLQSYITPDAFTFDLSVLFFIAILIGGRGSILGPLLGTILLTVLPEFAAPLVAWSTFLYAVLLLVIVLVMPGGIADLLDFKNRRPLESNRAIMPRPELLPRAARRTATPSALIASKASRCSFGGVRAIDGLDLDDPARRGARPDRPERQRQDHHAQRHLRLLRAAARARVKLDGSGPAARAPHHPRAASRIARTFQTPRLVGDASVLENVMIGGTIDGRGTLRRSRCSRCRAIAATSACCASARCWRCRPSDSKRSPRCAPTACSTASCASSRSRAP